MSSERSHIAQRKQQRASLRHDRWVQEVQGVLQCSRMQAEALVLAHQFATAFERALVESVRNAATRHVQRQEAKHRMELEREARRLRRRALAEREAEHNAFGDWQSWVPPQGKQRLSGDDAEREVVTYNDSVAGRYCWWPGQPGARGRDEYEPD